MEKYIKISRILITLLVFIVLNIWFIFENDPQWGFSIIITIIVFLINPPSSKICKILINKGDKIGNQLSKVLYYALLLPIIFLLLLGAVGLLYTLVIELFLISNSLNLGIAILIAFTGIGIFTCVLVPYFQTLIILLLRKYLTH